MLSELLQEQAALYAAGVMTSRQREQFEVVVETNAIVSLKPRGEGGAEFVQAGRRLGELFTRWRERRESNR